jgi:hypothetical protein
LVGEACKRAWHGECYKQYEKDLFPVLQAYDLEECLMGPEELEEEDPNPIAVMGRERETREN